MENGLPQRFGDNPILVPHDVPPTRSDFIVECLLNPGAFRYNGRIGLLIRVCERPPQEENWISFPVLDPEAEGGVRIMRFRYDDPKLVAEDPRILYYDNDAYLTTLSHLRLAWSDDGHRFDVEPQPALIGEGPLEGFGIEDCRVSQIGEDYILTYSATSAAGVGVALATTRDWKTFKRYGMVIPPANKDAAVFEQRIDGQYLALHRPSGVTLGGNYIWLARSPDLVHWGKHQCILRPRKDKWDCQRIGAGAAPILTNRGFLEIYHGADNKSRYCLGTMLMDASDPSKVLARSEEPIMEPTAEYETMGFFGNVIFTNGHVIRDADNADQLTIYYGAADSVICGADFWIEELLRELRV